MSDFTPRKPDFKGDGVAVWKATTREGKVYLRVSLFGGSVTVNCFQNEEPKPQQNNQQTTYPQQQNIPL